LARAECAPDLAAALAGAPQKIQNLWNEITPMARWEWVRWVNATKNPDTRTRRVEVSISKMQGGKRRPCCFNLSACTDPDLSKNGRLLEPGDDRPRPAIQAHRRWEATGAQRAPSAQNDLLGRPLADDRWGHEPCRTADRHILDRAPEIEAVRDSGARLVNLASDEAVTRFAQLEVVMCQWRRIESLLAETGPFIYFATRMSLRKARLPR
jgi:hypothetical protein